MKRMLCLATGLFLLLPAIALAADETTTTADEKFDPSEEWTLHPWISIHIGGVDMSVCTAKPMLSPPQPE